MAGPIVARSTSSLTLLLLLFELWKMKLSVLSSMMNAVPNTLPPVLNRWRLPVKEPGRNTSSHDAFVSVGFPKPSCQESPEFVVRL